MTFRFFCAALIFAVAPQLKAQVAITASDYCEFLNATAAADPQNLYDEKMESDLAGACVTREGAPGSYRYANQAVDCRLEAVDSGTPTVTFISAEDVAQYCNWLSNKVAKDSSSTSIFNSNCSASNVDPSLKSNQLTFQVVNLTASSNLAAPSSGSGDSSWERKLEEVAETITGIGLLIGDGEEAEGSLHENDLNGHPIDPSHINRACPQTADF